MVAKTMVAESLAYYCLEACLRLYKDFTNLHTKGVEEVELRDFPLL